MATFYRIEPSNEPWGEGNGWDLCEEHQATSFGVWECEEGKSPECDELIEAFETRAAAEAYVSEQYPAKGV